MPRPTRGYVVRQGILAALTANAVKPLNTEQTAIPAFVAGWLTSELAPQLLAVTAVDTLAEALAITLRRTTHRDGRLFFDAQVVH